MSANLHTSFSNLNMFETPKAQCAGQTPEAGLDDPAFANLNAQPGFEEGESPLPHMRRPARRPAPFDAFMNPVKVITKKFEQVKGFKFDFSVPMSHKFMMSHSWSITPPSQNQQPMGQKGQAAIYNLGLQYIGGDIDPYSPVPPTPAFILTGRMDSAGKLESAFMKNFDERTQLRIQAMFPAPDINYAQIHADLEYEGNGFFQRKDNNFEY